MQTLRSSSLKDARWNDHIVQKEEERKK